ncbi:MAG: hypothetical protein O2960_20025 [Verrucomicrobia bacterium]|nr:hypothetical protein [Verrucomicrobiota bacterium]
MNDAVLVESESEIELRHSAREKILKFEQAIASIPGAVFGDQESCPLKHSFAGGIYMREIFIPAGTLLVGKIHRHAHPRVILSGEIIQFSESGGRENIKGPTAMISPAGSKRAIFAITDYRAITFHEVGEERDLEEIEAMIIANIYEEKEGACLS